MTKQSIVDIYAATESVLLHANPWNKARQSIALYEHWLTLAEMQQHNAMTEQSASDVQALDSPGRPQKPSLVEPHQLARRGLGSLAGRVALLHSLAHIEFNAINLALDAVYRFRDQPVDYVTDWLKVASDEGQHFLLLAHRLEECNSQYGDLNAHDGLWEMARRTKHDVLVRMALVPRILEARGLDVAPPMIKKLKEQGDEKSAAILQRIYTDEITHVDIGNRWFRHCCEERGLNGEVVFQDLLKGKASAYLRSPYNDEARLQAGFTVEEMRIIRQMETEYKHGNTV